MRLQRLLWFVLLGTTAWGLLMSWEASAFKKPCPTGPGLKAFLCPAGAPIAPLELTTSPEKFKSLLDQDNASANEWWNIEVIHVNTCMDFLFIALYWGTIGLLARLQGRWPSIVVIALISAAAIFDVAENIRLLQALEGISSERSFPVPGAVSEIKWLFFAAALLALGVSLALAKKLWPLVMSVLMVSGAVLTALGSFHPDNTTLLPLAIVLLFLALLVALFLYFPFRPFPGSKFLVWIEFAYLIRFQLVAALLLAVVLPAGYFLFPSMFVGLFDALGFWSFVCVTAASVHLAWTVMITVRLVCVYGPSRFAGIANTGPAGNLSWSTAILFASLAAPCITLICCGTTALFWYWKLVAILIGIAISVAILWLNARVHFMIESAPGGSARAIFPFQSIAARTDQVRSELGQTIDRSAQRLLPGQSHPGLVTPEGRLRSGHQLAALVLVGTFAAYAAAGYYYSPTNPANELTAASSPLQDISHSSTDSSVVFTPKLTSARPPAALFYVLLLLSNLVLLFSGLAFLFDKFRLPVLLTALAFSFLVGIFGTDHLFRVTSTLGRVQICPTDAVRAWEEGRGRGAPNKPIVVVATAGGGIRAAAWTAQVLTGLVQQINTREHDFASSLLVVSSVSGGSLGNMYVVGSYGSDGRLDLNMLKGIRRDAERSSLSAVGWGLAYPDSIRTIPVAGSLIAGLGFGEEVDRGSALEGQWLANWKSRAWTRAPTIGEWTRDASNGIRPVAIFNATAVETGERYLISSNTLEQTDDLTIQFGTKYPHYDMLVSTAARASATFPWISPNPRLWDGKRQNKSTGVHLADGGYYDNSGILSAIQWLREAAPGLQNHPVLFLVIDATSGTPSDEGKAWSWQRQAVGPLETLLSVRNTAQISRAKFELGLVLNDLRAKCIDIKEYDLLYPPDSLAPLSWHLTREQIKRLHKAWSQPANGLAEQIKAIEAKLQSPSDDDQRPPACRAR